MPSPSSNSDNPRSSRIIRSTSKALASSSNNHEQMPSSKPGDNGSNSKSGGLLGRLKFPGSSKKRNNDDRSNSSIITVASTSSRDATNASGHSPTSLAQKLRALLDTHPVHSPPPRFQPLPSPTITPSPLSPAPPAPPALPSATNEVAFPIQSYEQLATSPLFSPIPIAGLSNLPPNPLFSPAAHLSPELSSTPLPVPDPELIALLSSPTLMNGALGPNIANDPPERARTPKASSTSANDRPAHTSPPRSRRQSVWSVLDSLGSPRARAKRLSRVDESTRMSFGGAWNEFTDPPTTTNNLASPSPSSSMSLSGYAGATCGSSPSLRDDITEVEDDDDDDNDDDTSIMMYSPLVPTPASLVSIAESEFVAFSSLPESEEDEQREIPIENEDIAGTRPTTQVGTATNQAFSPPVQEQAETRSGWGLSNLWPFSSWWSSSGSAPPSAPNPNPAASSSNSTQPQTPTVTSSVPPSSPPASSSATVETDATPRSPRRRSIHARTRTRRVWVPSRTELSLETMWWGYRIYIPPPVLDALDSTSVETSRRTALLTTALTWFFTHFPLHVLPPPVRPVVMILQGLVPYLGYVGGLLSWSWGTVKSYDEGYGVILTATWLLPIALIPSTWVPPPPDWPGSPLLSPRPVSPPVSPPISPSIHTVLSPQVTNSSMSPHSPPPFAPSAHEQQQSIQHQPYLPYPHARSHSPPLAPAGPSGGMSYTSPYLQPYSYQFSPLPNGSPVMALQPVPTADTNLAGSFVYTPVAAPAPLTPMLYTPYTPSQMGLEMSPTLSSASYVTAQSTPTPSVPTSLPIAANPVGTGVGLPFYAPRMSTVPLPDDER